MAEIQCDAKDNESSIESAALIKFCPICGSQMYQGIRYGFLCWICPECDYDEPA